MTLLLETIEDKIAEIEKQYQTECSRNYGSPTACYLLGQVTALKEARSEIKIAILAKKIAEIEDELGEI